MGICQTVNTRTEQQRQQPPKMENCFEAEERTMLEKEANLRIAACYAELETLQENVELLGSGRDERGYNTLHCVVLGQRSRALECVKFLVETHPELLRQKDNDGNTPLHWACCADDPISVSIISYMVTQDSQLMQITANDGRTPLHMACSLYKLHAASALLAHDSSYATDELETLVRTTWNANPCIADLIHQIRIKSSF